jgi:hypothetical protein
MIVGDVPRPPPSNRRTPGVSVGGPMSRGGGAASLFPAKTFLDQVGVRLCFDRLASGGPRAGSRWVKARAKRPLDGHQGAQRSPLVVGVPFVDPPHSKSSPSTQTPTPHSWASPALGIGSQESPAGL